MPTTYRIAGRLFRAVERSTLAHDFYVMKQIRRAGLDQCAPRPSESAQDYALRLLYAVVESGVPFELLGGLLVPEGVPDEQWSEEHAEATAAVLRQVTDAADKAEVQKLMIGLLTDFFREGLRFWNPSATASSPAQPQKTAAAMNS